MPPGVQFIHSEMPELVFSFKKHLDLLLATAPGDDANLLLQWSPGFKRRLTALCSQFNKQAQQRPEAATRAAISTALQALCAQCDSGDDTAVVLPLITAARQQLADADR